MRVQLGLPPSWLRTLLEPAAETLLLPGTFVGSSLSWGNGDIALTDREGSPSPSCPVNPSPMSPPSVHASSAVATSG